MNAHTLIRRTKIENKLGEKLVKCHTLPGSMREYLGCSIAWAGTQQELYQSLTERLGFSPFFCQTNYDGTFSVDLAVAKIDTLP